MKCVKCNKYFDRKITGKQCSNYHNINKWIFKLYVKYFGISLILIVLISVIIAILNLYFYISGIFALISCIWAMSKINKLIIEKLSQF